MAHRVSLRARGDLDEIWEYVLIESGSEATASRQIDLITNRFYLLTQWPLIGRKRDDLRRGLRSLAVGNYLIFYRVYRTSVLIERVLHARRDVRALWVRR